MTENLKKKTETWGLSLALSLALSEGRWEEEQEKMEWWRGRSHASAARMLLIRASGQDQLYTDTLSVCASCLTLCADDSECVHVTVCHLFHSMNIDERFCMQLQLLQVDVHIVCKEMKKSTENRLKTCLGLDQRCSSLPSPMVAFANKNNVHIPIPNFVFTQSLGIKKLMFHLLIVCI